MKLITDYICNNNNNLNVHLYFNYFSLYLCMYATVVVFLFVLLIYNTILVWNRFCWLCILAYKKKKRKEKIVTRKKYATKMIYIYYLFWCSMQCEILYCAYNISCFVFLTAFVMKMIDWILIMQSVSQSVMLIIKHVICIYFASCWACYNTMYLLLHSCLTPIFAIFFFYFVW